MKRLDRLKARIRERYLAPYLGRRNWRPADMIPLQPEYLQSAFGFDEEAAVKQAAAIVSESTMASFERLATLWQQVRYLDRNQIAGALVECGVWKGGCAGLMALAHLHSHATPFREIHLFDSFQGLPRPDNAVDGEEAIAMAEGNADGACIPIDCCTAEMEDSRRLLIDTIGYPAELVKFHVGWFQQTLPELSPSMEAIALLRLDGDWYHSTMLCLQYLYPRVAQYGVVVTDDYGHFEGCRKAVDEFVAGLEKPVLLNHIDYTARSWVKT